MYQRELSLLCELKDNAPASTNQHRCGGGAYITSTLEHLVGTEITDYPLSKFYESKLPEAKEGVFLPSRQVVIIKRI